MDLQEYRNKSVDEVRDKVMDLLATYYARGAIELEEYENRIQLATQSQSRGELEALLANLPALTAPAAAAPRPPVQPRSAPASEGLMLAEGEVRPTQSLASIFSSVTRRNEWYPARQTQAFAFFGSTDLDFRKAHIPPGVSTISVFACFGSVSIVVPPGVNVEMNGVGVFGSFDSNVPEMPRGEAPTIRIEGLAFFGSASVRVKRPKAE